jgi:hypothetical protein
MSQGLVKVPCEVKAEFFPEFYWMFAPGYYLCVFFWSLAFVFADVAPSSRVPGLALRWHPNEAGRAVGAVALR